jgi:hypothetical protein
LVNAGNIWAEGNLQIAMKNAKTHFIFITFCNKFGLFGAKSHKKAQISKDPKVGMGCA